LRGLSLLRGSAGQEHLSLLPGKVSLERGARGVAKPKPKFLQVAKRTFLQPGPGRKGELGHAGQYRPISGRGECDACERHDLELSSGGAGIDLTDSALSCRLKTGYKSGDRCKRHYDGEERTLVCTQGEMARAGSHDVAVPITKNAAR
jgi:hypothetical protein